VALIGIFALAMAGLGALDTVQPQAAPAVQEMHGQGDAAIAPSGNHGEDALDGHQASGDTAAGHGAPGDAAHGEDHGAGHGSPIAPVLILILIVILAAKLGGALMERFGQPGVLGELIIGVLLGNLAWMGFGGVEQLFSISVFGVMPAENMILFLGEIGVLLLLFEVGLESNIKEMMSVGVSSLLVACLGVVAPFFLGWGVGILFDLPTFVSVFLGATLCATSVGITARVLKDMNKIQLRESKIILGAAVIDDILGLVILAVVQGIIVAANANLLAGGDGSGGLPLMSVAIIIGKALAFLVGAIVIGQWASPRIFKLASKLRGQHMLLATSLLILFSLSWLADKMGLAAIVGAFAAGLILDEVHFRDFKDREKHTLEELLHPLAGFLVPIFFVYMGYRVKLAAFANTEILMLAGALTLVAILGKQICSLGVVEKGLDKISVGIGMVPRGEVGLIFASIGMGLVYAGTPIISEATYGAVVIMVIVTTLITPPALKWSLNRNRGYEGASDEEMKRIADERRERRKEYYRQRAREEGEGGGERRRGRGGRRGGRGGGERGRGGRGGRNDEQSGRKQQSTRAEGERDASRSDSAQGSTGEGGQRRRRRRPRRRRGRGGGGGGGGGKGGQGGGQASREDRSSGSSDRPVESKSGGERDKKPAPDYVDST